MNNWLSWHRLLEVCVGLAVIAILGAILWPVTASSGHPPPCMTNVTQIGLGQIMYSSDNNDRYPFKNWMDAIQPYAKNEMMLHCPTASEKNKDIYGYAMSSNLPGKVAPSHPDKAPMIFDSILLQRNAVGGMNTLPNPGRHDGGNFIAYVDGHAKKVQSPLPSGAR